MATIIGIGFSDEKDPLQATQMAAKEAAVEMPQGVPVHLCLVFTTPEYSQPDILTIIHNTLSPQRLIGCSTAGMAISQKTSLKGVSVVAVHSDETQFGIGYTDDLVKTPLRDAGIKLVRDCVKDYNEEKRNSFLFMTDGFFHNNSLLVKGIQEVLGNGFPTVGAVCSDYFAFQQTHQYYQDHFLTNGSVGLMIGGGSSLYMGNSHGWQPLGKPHFVDNVEGHIIRTIDGEPAVKLYMDYFGPEATQVMATKLSPMAILYPLGIYVEEENDYLLRNAIDILDDGSIVCQGEVPEGAEVHLMISNKEACREATQQAAWEVKRNLLGRQAKFVLIIESLTRHKVLGRTVVQEMETIKEVLGYTTPMIGIYSYGEIAPFRSLQKIKKPHVHNENIIILALG